MVFIQRFEEEAGVLFDKLVEQLGDPIKYAYPKLAIWEFETKERIKNIETNPYRTRDKFQTEKFQITLDGKNKKLFIDATTEPTWTFHESINDEFNLSDILEIENLIEWIINLPRKQAEFIPITSGYNYPTHGTSTVYGTPITITSTTTSPIHHPFITYTT